MRVIERVENGIPVKIAIGGEGVALDAYLEYLRAHPKLEALQGTARRKFMERAVSAMLGEEKPGVSYRWLLEHCHTDLLAQPGDESTESKQRSVIGGMTEEEVRQLQEEARKL